MRILAMLGVLALLGACSPSGADLNEPLAPLGQFSLGQNVVVASKAVKGPLSRPATEEELTAAMRDAIDARFSRYPGTDLFHLGVSVEAYVLAQPGIPLVASPKSLMIIRVSVWNGATQEKLTPEPEQITVFESLTGETAVGSGLTQPAKQQLHNLSVNAAKQIELLLARKQLEEGWFTPAPLAAE